MNASKSSDAACRTAIQATSIREFHEWRGRMVDLYAGCETAVRETLLLLRTYDASVGLPHVAGHCYDELRDVLTKPFVAASTPHANDALAKLTAFVSHLDQRNLLCHAPVKVLNPVASRWRVRLQLLTFVRKDHERSERLIDDREAADLLAVLSRDGSRLRCALGQVRRMF